MKSLGSAEIKNIKEKLIIFKNELIRKNRINNRIKKDLDDYNGIKDTKYLFNENEDKDIKRNAYYAEKIKKTETTYKESPFKSIK